MSRQLTKKQKDKIHAGNSFYDKYKAGKYDPMTKEFNHTFPSKKKVVSREIEDIISCSKCGNPIPISGKTQFYICNNCGEFCSI